MPEVKDLIEKYQEYPDKKLIEMLRYAKDYIPQAVEAAQQILDERSIGQEEIDEIVEKLEQKEKEQLIEKTKPLSEEEKFLFLFIPIVGLIFLLIATTDAQSKGQEKRISEMWMYSGIGMGAWILILFLLNGF
ncbi:MAG: hypothetical protein MRZ79_25410 [Bacteroidia bacterium]|nr:hypothetical protein [Bacteroidia bacterium]